MSDRARQYQPQETDLRPPSASGPLRDWLAAMRAAAAENQQAAAKEPAFEDAQPEVADKSASWAPRIVPPAAPADAGQQPAESETATPDADRPVVQVTGGATDPKTLEDADVVEIMAENLMLKAQLRLEIENRGVLQRMLADEIRDLRAHITGEMSGIEELRAERDLWKARCEALASPLFQKAQTR